MMDPVDDLVVWLRAQLDEDYRLAEDAGCGRWEAVEIPGPKFARGECAYVRAVDGGEHVATYRWTADEDEPLDDADAQHIAEHDPARVLAEVGADRRLLDLYEAAAREYAADGRTYDYESEVGRERTGTLAEVIKIRALPYSDRPGYQESWRP